MTNLSLYTDSCSDLLKTNAEKLEIKIIPTYYYFDNDNTEYGDENNMCMEEFFSRIRSGHIPRSSSANVGYIYNVFKEDILLGKDIICVNISSKLSCNYNNCVLAANMIKKEFPSANIHVIDSLSGSMGQNLIVQDIKNQNLEFNDIVSKFEKEKNLYHIEFFVNTLEFLYRGGRLNKTAYNIGKIVNIKPLIGVDNNGENKVLLKTTGEKRLQKILIERMLKNIDTDSSIGIVHSNAKEKADLLKEKIENLNLKRKILLSEISPVIATHIGPDAIGLAYKLRNN